MAKNIRLYNTRARKKESLKTAKKGVVGLYTCGPTVYNFAHIGNLRTYIFEDELQRTLEWNGLKVRRVMNITDVGHLTGDGDAGEDKMEKKAKTKKDVEKIAKFYAKTFFGDLKKLNVKIPETIAPATKFIHEQIKMAKVLIKKGYAYETPQAVYFDVSKFKKYGKLSGQSLKEKMTAARKEVVTDAEKHNPADFALWFKLTGKFKNHLQRWPSPWGKGFPGWHIECSAISRKFLGQPFDIHTGGVDHIGTHHENEIAQSEAAYGKPLAGYWLHGEFLLIDKNRMGKSERNFFTLKDVEKKGFNPLAFRYLVLGTHYRSKLNFTWESLKAAENGLESLYDGYSKITAGKKEKPGLKAVNEYKNKFKDAVNDDLNIPKALALAHKAIKDRNLTASEKRILMTEFDKIFGLRIEESSEKRAKIPAKIGELAEKREEYRRSKQFVQADRLRDEINRLGYVIEDTKNGPKIRPKK